MSNQTKETAELFSFKNITERFATVYSDKQLISKFHSYPFKSLIVNLITTVLFAIGLWYIYNPDPAIGSYLPFAWFAVGAISIIVFQKLYPPFYKKAIAQAMMIKYKTQSDTSKDPYFYYYRREYQTLGKLKKSGAETFFKVLGILVKIINFVFYLLSAALMIVFSAMIAILGGGILFVSYIIFMAGRANALAELCLRGSKASFLLLKWAFVFLGRVLTFRDFAYLGETTFHENDFKNQKTATNDFMETDPKKMGRSLSELRIDSYLSLSGVVMPAYATWEGTPRISASGSTVYVEGTIKADSFVYKTQAELDQLLDKCKDDIFQEVTQQVETFLHDYPNAEKATIKVELDGYIA